MTAFYLQVENLKKAIKASSQSDMDNGGVSGMPASYHSQQYQQKAPTTSKTKGLVYLISVLLDVQALNFVQYKLRYLLDLTQMIKFELETSHI